MIKSNLMIGAMAAAMLLTGCATAGDQSESSNNSAPREKSLADARPEPSADQPVPEARGPQMLTLIGELYDAYPFNGEGKPTLSVSIEKNDQGQYLATIIVGGFLDDSVAVSKDVLTLEMEQEEWRVVRKQSWRKCYRTSMFEWTTKPCP